MVPDASASEFFPDVSEWHQVSTAIFLERIWTLPFFGADFKDHQTFMESCQEREGELRKKLAEEQVRIPDDPRLSKLSQLNIR
jgi:hypothetical protein